MTKLNETELNETEMMERMDRLDLIAALEIAKIHLRNALWGTAEQRVNARDWLAAQDEAQPLDTLTEFLTRKANTA